MAKRKSTSATTEAALSARIAELETVAEVSTAITSILNLDELLQKVVDLSKKRFNLYHAHIYVLSEDGKTLSLTAGADNVGRKMVEQGWHINVTGEQSLVGQAATKKEAIVVDDVTQAANFLPNPDLPDTRSELAVPILLENRVLGVFDVQSEQVAYFTPEQVRVHRLLASQLAPAMYNAQLFKATQSAKQTAELQLFTTQMLQKLSRTLAETKDIKTMLRHFFDAAIQQLHFDFMIFAMRTPDGLRLQALDGVGISQARVARYDYPLNAQNILLEVVHQGNVISLSAPDPRLAVLSDAPHAESEWWHIFLPITLRGEIAGVVEAGFYTQPDGGAGQLNQSEIQLLRAFIDHTALAVDNARLLEQVQRTLHQSEQRLAQEQVLRRITERVRGSVEVETVLRLAAKELGQSLNRPVFISLDALDSSTSAQPQEEARD